jgi:hypothetical protein
MLEGERICEVFAKGDKDSEHGDPPMSPFLRMRVSPEIHWRACIKENELERAASGFCFPFL